MGTEIELTISHVSLSYSKNSMGIDYGYLFQPTDLAHRPAEGINYEYFSEHPDELPRIADIELGFARSLRRVLPRLQVLGYTLEEARREYQAVINEAVSIFGPEHVSAEAGCSEVLTFDEFCDLACRYPLTDLSSSYIEYETKGRDVIAQGRFAAHAAEIRRMPWTETDDLYWSESSYVSKKLCILSAESMLQVFSLNPANADLEVVWQFGPIVDAGWVES